MMMGRETDAAGSLRLEKLRKTYAGFTAVEEFDLEVVSGEFLSLLGSSGSGKTTTLMMIAGFIQPTSGEVYIGNQAMRRLDPHKRNLGLVFQNYALFPHMTAAENVAFPLKMRRYPSAKIRELVDRTLELVGLAEHSRKLPRQLSGGQQQRVALARAIVFRPHALLLDEPLGALDKGLRERLQTELKEIQTSLGTTVIHVTHDQEEAFALSDRIAVMHGGRLEQVAAPNVIYERPVNEFVARFVGDVNVFGCTVLSMEGASQVVLRDESCGATLLAQVERPYRAGERVKVIVRPEKLGIGEDGTSSSGHAPPGFNCLEGQVRSRTYAGDRIKLSVATTASQLISVNSAAVAPTLGRPEFAGSAVTVRWAPGAMHVLPDGK